MNCRRDLKFQKALTDVQSSPVPGGVKMPLKIVRNDIVRMNTEAIVNTANEHPVVGAGCDRAVYQAAGYDKLLKYRVEKIGIVPEGEAFITPGFDLPAKYIIHAVSPLYLGGGEGEEKKLRACYRSSLKLAKKYGIRSIAFPLISTGGFGYPKEEGMRIAVDEINAFLLGCDMDIDLVVFDDKARMLGRRIYPDLKEYIDQNYVDNRTPLNRPRRAEHLPSSRPDFSTEFRTDSSPSSRPDSSKKFWSNFSKASRPDSSPLSRPNFSKASREEFDSESSVYMNASPSYAARDEEEPFLDFETAHESRLEERMRHLSDTFSQYLMYMIQSKGMENAEVYKRAIVDKKIFSKIKNNINYHPQKLTALCLCVGAKLNMDETRDLLARAGYALSPCDKTDIIFSYFIENRIYDMIELDIQLEEHGLPCIIT